MFKKLLSVACLLFLSLVTFAQSAKPKVYVKKFETSLSSSEENLQRLKQTVLHALDKTNRFEMTDATKFENNSDDTNELTAIVEGGFSYMLEGQLLSFEVSRTTKDGKSYYNCKFSYSVTMTDVKDSKTIFTQTFDHGTTTTGILDGLLDYTTPEEAINGVAGLIEDDIKKVIIENLPLQGVLIPMDYVVKKNKIVECYIELGSALGVKNGDYFNVTMPKSRAGRTIYSKVARLKVTEVVDETVSMCKVIDGEKELFNAMNDFLQLDEETQKKRPFKVEGSLKKEALGLGLFGL